MKKLIFVFILILNFAHSSFAEEKERTMNISASPLALPFGRLDVLYQLKLLDYLSLTFPAHYGHNWVWAPLISSLDERLKGSKNFSVPFDIGAGMGVRFLLANDGLVDGMYVEPRVQLSYSYLVLEAKGENRLGWNLVKLSPTANLGWDWYYDSGVSLSVGGGVGYEFFLKNTVSMPAFMVDNFFGKLLLPAENSIGRLAWDLEFKIGYAW